MNRKLSPDTINELRRLTKGKFLLGAPLHRYTSLKVGGPAEIMIYPLSTAELQRIIRFTTTSAIPCFTLGRGTNLLVRDGGIPGVVLKLSLGFKRIKIAETHGSQVKVFVEAGTSLTRFLNFTMGKGLSGAEFLTGIPGSIGGALAMNAGALGKCMQDLTESVTWITPAAEIAEISQKHLSFAYRMLYLPRGTIIISALMQLQKEDEKKMREEVERIKTWRRKHQPLSLPSAGSVFKNPPGEAAGHLIEKSGLKGYQIGGAKVSETHANFIVNAGRATAKEILLLITTIQQKVYQDSRIWLEPEITIVGENGTP